MEIVKKIQPRSKAQEIALSDILVEQETAPDGVAEGKKIFSYVEKTIKLVSKHPKETLIIILFLALVYCIALMQGINVPEMIKNRIFPPEKSVKTEPGKTEPEKSELPEDVKSLNGSYIARWTWTPGCKEGNPKCWQTDNVEIKVFDPIPNKPGAYWIEGLITNPTVGDYKIYGFYEKGTLALKFEIVDHNKVVDKKLLTFDGMIYLTRKGQSNEWCGYWRGDHIDDNGKRTTVGNTAKLAKK